jgi:hypothetical protein
MPPAASGGMMCPSYPATRHDSTCEHTSVREEPVVMRASTVASEAIFNRAD